MTKIEVGSGVTEIVHSAFMRCDFTSIVIPNSVEYIGEWVFEDCKNLTSITVPDTITIYSNAFELCNNISEVTITANGGNASNVQ